MLMGVGNRDKLILIDKEKEKNIDKGIMIDTEKINR